MAGTAREDDEVTFGPATPSDGLRTDFVPQRGSLKGRLRPLISDEVIARASQMEWHEIEEEAWRLEVMRRYGPDASGE